MDRNLEGPLWEWLILFWSVNKHGRHRQFLFLMEQNEPTLYRTFHRCFLPSFGSFGKAVSEEKIFRNRPIKNKNCLWQPYLLMDQDEMSNHFVPIINKHGHHRQLLFLIGQFLKIFYSEAAWPNGLKHGRKHLPPIVASYQVSVHLAKRFQKRRFFRNHPIRNKNCLWWPYL
jgi:hypothetical protein